MANKKTKHLFDKTSFIKTFNSIALHKHRYEVFADFTRMSAISLHNAIVKDEALEKEYLEIVGRYKKEDVDKICELLANLVVLLEVEPTDVLGELYAELELSSEHTGQFFTPSPVADLMAKLTSGADISALKDKAFITLSEPACGAGGMVLAFVKEMLAHGYNPAEKLWVQCVDIDRVMALMCYVQLSLWNVPALVIVGNSLSMEYREFFYTPAHYLFGWTEKLRIKRAFELVFNIETEISKTDHAKQEPIKKPVEVKLQVEHHANHKKGFKGNEVQFDLFF
jgi:type I restriction-modification system DNA methylase subunit